MKRLIFGSSLKQNSVIGGKGRVKSKAEKVSGAVEGQSYFSKSVEELKKVTFPGRQETIQTSIWTVLFVLLFAIVLSLLDVIFKYVMFWLV